MTAKGSAAKARAAMFKGSNLAFVAAGPFLPGGQAALRTVGRIRATVSPIEDGFGATSIPQALSRATFSCALSPKAEMIAPACPICRPFGAARPAIYATTGLVM